MEEDSVVRLKMIDETDRGMRSISSNLKTVDQNFAKVTAAAIKAAGGWQKWEAASLKASAEAAKHQAKSIEVQQKSSTEIQRILDRETRARMDAARRVEDSERKKSEASNRSARETERHSQRAARAVREHAGVVSGALGGMASRYLGAAAAAETARRAFTGFAATDDLLRKMQNQAGSTAQEMANLKKELNAISDDTGQGLDDLIKGFNELRERAGLSLADTQKIFKDVAQGALAMGVPITEMGVAYGAMMRNLGIDAKDAGKAMDILAKGEFDFALQMSEAIKGAPKLTEAMQKWGYSGLDGLARMQAFLASIQKATGDTGKSTMALANIMEKMDNPAVAEALGISAKKLIDVLNQAKKSGDPLGAFVSMVKDLADTDEKLAGVEDALGIRLSGAARQLTKDVDVMNDRIVDARDNVDGLAKKAADLHRAGPLKAINDLTNAFKQLGDELALVMQQFGVPEGLKWLVKEMALFRADIQASVDAIKLLYKFLFSPKAPGATMIRPDSTLDKLFQGKPLIGEMKAPKDEKEAAEALKKFNLEMEEAVRNLKKMSMTVDVLGGGPRVIPASYGGGRAGPGGARVWNASYGGGGGGGGGYGGHGGAGAYQGGGGGYGGYSGGGGSPGGGGGGPGASPGGGASGRGAGAPGPASGSTPTMGAGNTNWGNVGSSGYWKTGTDASGKSAAPAEAGGTGGAGGGSGGSSALPANILSQAQEMAKLGPGPLSAYMKSVGYPKNDAWCGDFAATAVKAAGGTPPKNPQMASNWRNFGTEVTDPQPGDVAVRRPEYHGRLGPGTTGSAGSHVNIVESANATTFGSIGGNQERRAEYARKQFQFYRGGGGGAQQEASAANGEGAGEGLKAHVREMEGFSSESYGDYGQTTHGYGTSGSGSISEADARKESGDQVDAAFDKVSKRWPDAPIGVRRALASLEYNSNFMDKSKERATALREALDRKDYASARQLFSDSKHVTKDKQGRPLANEKVLPGLEDRRNKELARYWDDPKQQTQSAGRGASSGKGPDLKGYAKEGASADDAGGTWGRLRATDERDRANWGRLRATDESDRPDWGRLRSTDESDRPEHGRLKSSGISDDAGNTPSQSKKDSYNEWDTLPPTDDNQKYPGRSRTDILKDEERGMERKNNRPSIEDIQHPESRGASFDEAKRTRSELEKPIKVKMDLGGSSQFGRASMRREANREVREARWNSQSDIGAA